MKHKETKIKPNKSIEKKRKEWEEIIVHYYDALNYMMRTWEERVNNPREYIRKLGREKGLE
jgi:hypothetical protein